MNRIVTPPLTEADFAAHRAASHVRVVTAADSDMDEALRRVRKRVETEAAYLEREQQLSRQVTVEMAEAA